MATRSWPLIFTAALLAAGCQRPRPLVYDPPATLRAIEPGLADPAGGFTVLRAQATQGRFPCSLAVARLGQSPGGGPAVTLAALAPAEQARWSEAFRGCPLLSDVRYLSPRSIQPEGPEALTAGGPAAVLCSAARRAQATLLLVYLLSRDDCDSAQALGVLYDVASAQPLAALRAEAGPAEDPRHRLPAVAAADGTYDCPDREPDGAPVKRDGKHGSSCCDPRPGVLSQFQQHALACLRDQVSRDTPPEAPQPHRWTPLYPYAIVPVTPPPPPAKSESDRKN